MSNCRLLLTSRKLAPRLITAACGGLPSYHAACSIKSSYYFCKSSGSRSGCDMWKLIPTRVMLHLEGLITGRVPAYDGTSRGGE